MFNIGVEQETDDRWLAEVLELPGVMSYGASHDEAIAKVQSPSRRGRPARARRSQRRLPHHLLQRWLAGSLAQAQERTSSPRRPPAETPPSAPTIVILCIAAVGVYVQRVRSPLSICQFWLRCLATTSLWCGCMARFEHRPCHLQRESASVCCFGDFNVARSLDSRSRGQCLLSRRAVTISESSTKT